MSGTKKKDSPAAYADVKTVLDYALEHPGLLYKLKSHGSAMNFRLRCHQFRQIVRDQESELSFGVPGFRPEIAYDQLIIRQINESGESDRKGHILRFEHHEMDGVMIDPVTGEEIKL